jgi:hypothetical protein
VFTVALWVLPALIVIAAGAPGVPVAVNVVVIEVEFTVAESVFAPDVVPSVQLVSVAIPLAFVVAAPPTGETLPPPEATANVTLTPAFGLLFASVTSTDGAVATAVLTVAL